jgi:lactate dehydrogenase-like 2-hydroxyacid dehydrogenase
MKKKVLLSRAYNHLPGMEEMLGREVQIVRSAGKQHMQHEIGSVHGLMTSGMAITEDLIGHAAMLQVIATPTVGYDNIDVGAATRYGIPVIANTGVA